MKEFPPIGAVADLDGVRFTYCRSMDVEGWWSADRTQFARPFDYAGQGLHVLWDLQGRQIESNGPTKLDNSVTVMATDPGRDDS